MSERGASTCIECGGPRSRGFSRCPRCRGRAVRREWYRSRQASVAVGRSAGVTGRPVVLDTETTGLGLHSELVEIAILDADSGEVLYNAPVMPDGRIPAAASAVHGLDRRRLRGMDAKRWSVHHEAVSRILGNASRVLAYNAEFDRRLLEQTAGRFGLTLPDADWECIMLAYARGGRWAKLSEACEREGIPVTGAHRALDDARMARELLRRMEVGESFGGSPEMSCTVSRNATMKP